MGFYTVAVSYKKTQHTNNTPHSKNTGHKTTQTIKDTVHTIFTHVQKVTENCFEIPLTYVQTKFTSLDFRR
jgi:hypothetical protein